MTERTALDRMIAVREAAKQQQEERMETPATEHVAEAHKAAADLGRPTHGVYRSEMEPQPGETVTNERGGKQSHVAEDFTSLDPRVYLVEAQGLGFGARKYGRKNYLKIEPDSNLNHAVTHIMLWLAGDRSEPHLVNARMRLGFALEMAMRDGEQPAHYNHPEVSDA